MANYIKEAIPLYIINQLDETGVVYDTEHYIGYDPFDDDDEGYPCTSKVEYIVRDGEFVKYTDTQEYRSRNCGNRELVIPDAYWTYETEEQFEAEKKRIRAEYEADQWYDPETETNPYGMEAHNSMGVAMAKVMAFNKYNHNLQRLEKAWKKKFDPASSSPRQYIYQPDRIKKEVTALFEHISNGQLEGDFNTYEAARILLVRWQCELCKANKEDMANGTVAELANDVAKMMVERANQYKGSQRDWRIARDTWLLVKSAGYVANDTEIKEMCNKRAKELEDEYWGIPQDMGMLNIEALETVKKAVISLPGIQDSREVCPLISNTIPQLHLLKEDEGGDNLLYLHMSTLLVDSVSRYLLRSYSILIAKFLPDGIGKAYIDELFDAEREYIGSKLSVMNEARKIIDRLDVEPQYKEYSKSKYTKCFQSLDAIDQVLKKYYKKANKLNGGLTKMKKNGKYGMIDGQGNEILPFIYGSISAFNNGWARVGQNGRYGVINTSGEVLCPCEYDEISALNEELIKLKKEGKYRLLNISSKEISSGVYQEIYAFKEGIARVERDYKCGIINTEGKEVVPCIYERMDAFNKGLAKVKLDDRYGFIDPQGNEIIPCEYEKLEEFRENLVRVKKEGKWGFIDAGGQVVSPLVYDEAYDYHEGMARVKQAGKCGFIGKNGEVVIPFLYDDANSFSGGLAKVRIKAQGCGYIDKTGQEVIPCMYRDSGDFYNGFAWVCNDEGYGFINMQGEVLVPFIYDGFDCYENGIACVWDGDDVVKVDPNEKRPAKPSHTDEKAKTIARPQHEEKPKMYTPKPSAPVVPPKRSKAQSQPKGIRQYLASCYKEPWFIIWVMATLLFFTALLYKLLHELIVP